MFFIPTSQTLLRDALTYYVNTVSVKKRSYQTEIYRIKALADLLGDLPLAGISPMHVVAFRDKRLTTPHPRIPDRTLSASTVKLELMMLSHVFSTAMSDWGMEDLTNPVAKVRKPKTPPGRARRLSSAEEMKLLRAATRHKNPHFYPIIVLALETACRQGELLAARWERIDWRERILHLPMTKNGTPRDIPLSRKACSILLNHLSKKSEGRIFDRYSASGLKSSWWAFIKGLGIDDFHFHDLRHCAISSLLERGLNTIEVSEISGHQSMQMLKRYSHLSARRLVKKLDPKPVAKKYRPILKESLPAYPAIVTQGTRRVEVDFPDFIDLRVSGTPKADILSQAKDALLRRLVTLLCEGVELPPPSSVAAVVASRRRARVEIILPLS